MIDLSGERVSDNIVGYFAYFQLINGAEKTIYMTRKEAEDWRDKYSPSAKSNYSPWKTDFDKMAMKTCLRRLISTYGIMSVDMQEALIGDQEQPEANSVPVQPMPQQSVTIDAETGEVVDDLP